MSEGFRRTLQTAADADGIAALLDRVSKLGRLAFGDAQRLETLARRYTDYAAALRDSVAAEDAPAPDQGVLL